MAGISKRVSGSWVSGDYALMKTATDTITDLPAVLYPNDSIAIVGLKGQTLQASTPSLTSPVMPRGTGDLETIGTKAGQFKIPVSSAGQTTPVYLGEVQTVRRVKKLVLTGNETFIFVSSDSNRTVCSILIANCIGNFGFCTHIEWKQQYQNTEYDRLVWNTNYGGILYISLSNIYLSSQTATAFKAYLAQQYTNGTPVTIWYVLSEPTTETVNEPLMKIGTYSDEVSNISIPVTAGGDTLSVGTTVQPSEVTVNYKGWHPVADVHERSGGQWD